MHYLKKTIFFVITNFFAAQGILTAMTNDQKSENALTGENTQSSQSNVSASSAIDDKADDKKEIKPEHSEELLKRHDLYVKNLSSKLLSEPLSKIWFINTQCRLASLHLISLALAPILPDASKKFRATLEQSGFNGDLEEGIEDKFWLEIKSISKLSVKEWNGTFYDFTHKSDGIHSDSFAFNLFDTYSSEHAFFYVVIPGHVYVLQKQSDGKSSINLAWTSYGWAFTQTEWRGCEAWNPKVRQRDFYTSLRENFGGCKILDQNQLKEFFLNPHHIPLKLNDTIKVIKLIIPEE